MRRQKYCIYCNFLRRDKNWISTRHMRNLFFSFLIKKTTFVVMKHALESLIFFLSYDVYCIRRYVDRFFLRSISREGSRGASAVCAVRRFYVFLHFIVGYRTGFRFVNTERSLRLRSGFACADFDREK